MGLPPPPEFLPIGLETSRDDELAAITLTGIPPVLVGDRGEGLDVERDANGHSIVEPLPLPSLRHAGGHSPLLAPRDASGRSIVEPLPLLDPRHGLRPPVDAVPPAPRARSEIAPAGPAGEADDDPPRAAEHADADELDIDVSEDTLPRVAMVREAYPALPPATPSQVPTAPVPVVPGPASRQRPVTGSKLAALPSVPRRRPLTPWVAVGAGVGAVISMVALWWLLAASPAKDAAPTPDVDPTPAKPPKVETAPEPPRPDATVTEATGEAKRDAKPDVIPPVLAPDDAREPVAPPPADDVSVITVARDDSAYDRAAAEYEETGSQRALLSMTTAACNLGQGPRARAAFRKLVGKALRSQAMTACRAAKVDVTSSVDGYTGPELLAQARAALAAGDAKTAFEKAHASNKVERSSEAVVVKGVAACKLGDRAQAQRLLPHVAVKVRPRLVEGCRALGIELRE